jgi:pimeloyl-ACP methyl ester carboxylesterase
MGASTALTLAGTHPDVPGAILLEDPPAWWVAEAEAGPQVGEEERQAREHAWLIGMKSKTREELIAEQRVAKPGWSEDELGPIADAMLRLSPTVLNRRSPATFDWAPIFSRITCPALLITGDPSCGASLTEESAASLRALIPQLRIAHIPDAGHNIHLDQFERYMQVVRAFLKEAAASSLACT